MLGAGRTAEVYALSNNRIAKLFLVGCDEAMIQHEYRISSAVAATGLPVPQVYAVTAVNGRHAIVYERICGPTLLQALHANPGSVTHFARQMAHVQAGIHQRSPSGLPSRRETLRTAIARAALPPVLKELAMASLDRMRDGEALCHGDFHPGNIIISAGGPVVIDWNDAAIGHPLADVARTHLLLQMADTPSQVQPSLERLRLQLCDTYLNHYLISTGRDRRELEDWQVPVAAARLAEQVPGEAEHILQMLAQRMG